MDFCAAASAASMAGKISCPVQSHRKAEVFGATMIHYNLPGANWQSTRVAAISRIRGEGIDFVPENL
jgi:hypothetical protein